MPFILCWAALPLVALSQRGMGPEFARQMLLRCVQVLFPLGMLLWEMVCLYPWADGDERESLRAIHRRRRVCAPDVLWLALAGAVLMVPPAFWYFRVYGTSWEEVFRLGTETCLYLSVMYLLTMLTRSVVLGVLPVILWLFLGFFGAGTAWGEAYFRFQAELPITEETMYQWGRPMMAAAAICLISGSACERLDRRA